MGYTKDLLEGVAQYLAAGGVGVWKSSGVYTSTETGIILRTLPQSPDRVIVLAAYPVANDPSLSTTVTGMQVTTRWGGADPRPTDDLTDAVFDRLHGAHGIDLPGGIRLVECLHRSGSTQGQDANQRWRNADNYYLTTHRPSPHRQ